MEIAYGYEVTSHNDEYVVMMKKSNIMLQKLTQSKALAIFPWGEFLPFVLWRMQSKLILRSETYAPMVSWSRDRSLRQR